MGKVILIQFKHSCTNNRESQRIQKNLTLVELQDGFLLRCVTSLSLKSKLALFFSLFAFFVLFFLLFHDSPDNQRIWYDIYHPQTKFVKVMFLHMSVILSRGGAIPACIAAGLQGVGWGVVSQHALQVSRPTLKGEVWGVLARGGSAGPQPRGKLMGIWSKPTAKGEIEGDLVQAHTQGGS